MSTQEKSELYNMFIEVLTPHFDREIKQGDNIISKLEEISNVLKPSEL